MKTRILKISGIAGLAGLIVFLLFVFTPREYDVPGPADHPGVRFWELSTGSKIAYSFIPALENTKPYPVIYLHGGPGGCITRQIRDELQPLSAIGYDIYLYDQIGSGRSERLESIGEYTAIRHKNDLAEIIDSIGAEHVILIGHSWGAMLATLYLADYPARVAKAVFTGPGPVLPVQRHRAELKAPDSLNLLAPRFTNGEGNKKAYHIRAKSTLWWAYAFGNKLTPDAEADGFFTFLNRELGKSTVCDPAHAVQKEGGGGYYAHIMTVKSFSDVEDAREKLKSLQVPLLIMRGQCDNQPWGFTSEYLELFPDHHLVVIENAGHGIALEQPALYLQHLTAFLEDSMCAPELFRIK